LFAPYQALDMYVSVRIAESSALAMAPVALLGLLRALDQPSVMNLALGAAAAALLPLAHNAIALLMFPVFAAIIFARSAISGHRLKTAAVGATVLAGGLGLSAFFWLPALAEKGLVKTDLLRTGFLNWSNYIIYPSQLLWSHWGFGYSIRGPGNGISYSLGLIHIVLAIAGVVIGLRAASRIRRLDTIAFSAASIGAALLATDWSWRIWQQLSTLQYLAYPWRALCVPALFMPLLAGFAFERIRGKAAVVVIVVMVAANLHHTQPKGYLVFDDEFYYPASIAQRGLNTTTREEYEPRWVQQRLRYTGDGILTPTPLTAVRITEWNSTRHMYSVSSPGLARVTDSTDYYPGWRVLIDGHAAPITPVPIFGTISFQVPPGSHTITVELQPTALRRVALLISVTTLAILLILFAARYAGSDVPETELAQPTIDQSPESAAAARSALLKSRLAGLEVGAVAGLVLLHVCASLWSASRESATYDEVTIIPAGYARLALHDYRLTPVTAPLMPMLAGLAIHPLHPHVPLGDQSWKDGDGWSFGYSFLYGEGRGRLLLWRARLPFLALSAMLAVTVFLWARQLWGTNCGFAALFLYALNPELLAHSHYANLDLAISLVAALALWAVWGFLRSPTVGRGALAVAALAVAPVTKYSFPLVFVMVTVVALANLLNRVICKDYRGALSLGGRLLLITIAAGFAAWLVVWAVFGFKAQDAATAALSHPPPIEQLVPEGLLRGLLVAAHVHRLLPDGFVNGVATMIHLPQTVQMSFLFGRATPGGWWYYFPVALLLKTPLPLLILLISTAFLRGPRDYAQPALVTLALPATVYLGLAMGFRFNIGYRRLLPLLPLICIWGGRQVIALWNRQRLRPIALMLLGWYALGTWRVAPHFLSFFNEIAGGPDYGYHYLADSNCDWGQDLEELGRLCQRLGLHRIKLSYFGSANPDDAGLRYEALPRVACCWQPQRETMSLAKGDVVAVSVTNLMGVYARLPGSGPLPIHTDFDGRPRTMPFVDAMAYLDSHYQPFARAGYSILLYRLKPSDSPQRALPFLISKGPA
jgi:hypothetical protein